MTSEKIKNNIKQLTVKITVTHSESNKEIGTGVIVFGNSAYYILTSYHCIFGKNDNTEISINDIDVEKDFSLNEYTLRLTNIITFKKNLVLIEFTTNKDLNITKCIYLPKAIEDKTYYLRGYPKILKGQAHNFEAQCNDNDISEIDFRMTIQNLNAESSGEEAINYIQGLSGSGIFFEENNNLYLTGLTNSIIGQGGAFGSVNCIKLIDLYLSEIPITDYYSIDDLSKKLKDINKSVSEDMCAKYEEDNNDYYENLDRKNRNLYHKDEVTNKNFQTIKNYLEGQNVYSELQLYDNTFEKKILDLIDNIIENITHDYEKHIDTKKEGKANLKEIRTYVQTVIEKEFNFIKDDIYLISKIRNYIVNAWLLNCNLDFKLDEE